MNLRFELNRSKKLKSGLIPIRMIVTYKDIRFKKNVPKAKCLENDWDNNTYMIKTSKESEYYSEYVNSNNQIAEIKNKVSRIFQYFEFNEIEFTKDKFLNKFDDKTLKLKLDFFEGYDEYLDEIKYDFSHNTIKNKKSFKNKMLDFQDEMKYKITYDSIDVNFENKLKKYFFDKKKHLNSHYNTILKEVKAFMNWSIDKEYHNNYNHLRFKKLFDEIEVIYLEGKELEILYTYDFKKNYLNRARDLFCFMCFTSIRVKDLLSLKNHNFSDTHLTLFIGKNKKNAHRILLSEPVKAILNKYKGTKYEPLPLISDVKLNLYIKECCEVAGINQEMTITRFSGNRRIDKKYKKSDLITNHIGRKTFITQSLIRGMSEIETRKISNHKTEKSFKKYVNLPQVKVDESMKETWNTFNK